MAICNFCGKNINIGTGILYAKKDGKVLNFCSSKCEKNMIKLGRKARNLKWTKEYKKGG